MTILSKFKLSFQLRVYVVKSLSKLINSRDSRDVSELRGEYQVIANIGKEEGLLGRGVLGTIGDKLGKGQVIDPIVLLIRAVCTDIGPQRLIGSFCEPIGVRVISSRMSKVDGKMGG